MSAGACQPRAEPTAVLCWIPPCTPGTTVLLSITPAPMGIGCFSGVFASLEPVPGQDWSLAFPLVSVLGMVLM